MEHNEIEAKCCKSCAVQTWSILKSRKTAAVAAAGADADAGVDAGAGAGAGAGAVADAGAAVGKLSWSVALWQFLIC